MELSSNNLTYELSGYNDTYDFKDLSLRQEFGTLGNQFIEGFTADKNYTVYNFNLVTVIDNGLKYSKPMHITILLCDYNCAD